MTDHPPRDALLMQSLVETSRHRDTVEQHISATVEQARRAGTSWERIAEHLGLSEPECRRRYTPAWEHSGALFVPLPDPPELPVHRLAEVLRPKDVSIREVGPTGCWLTHRPTGFQVTVLTHPHYPDNYRQAWETLGQYLTTWRPE